MSQCLICSKNCKSNLFCHVKRMHGLSSSDYYSRFGLTYDDIFNNEDKEILTRVSTARGNKFHVLRQENAEVNKQWHERKAISAKRVSEERGHDFFVNMGIKGGSQRAFHSDKSELARNAVNMVHQKRSEDPEYDRQWRDKKSESAKSYSNTPEGQEHLSRAGKLGGSSDSPIKRAILLNGGFGIHSTSEDGHHCESSYEVNICNFLSRSNISHTMHPRIPDRVFGTSKRSDFYLPDLDLWIEVDGVNRSANGKINWGNKLEVYEANKLTYIIVKTVEDIELKLAERQEKVQRLEKLT